MFEPNQVKSALPGISAPCLQANPRARQFFLTDDLQQRLGRSTAKGGMYAMGASSVNFLVTTFSTLLITRNLADEDFGLFGMVMVLAGFAAMFVDLGLSRAVVQRERITHVQVSNLFWINLVVSILISFLVILSTPVLVWFYQESRLAPVNIALSALFVLSALGMQHRALLLRRLEHGRINIVNIISTLIASVVGILVAVLGGGVWALVALPAVSQLTTVLGMWLFCPWVPCFPRRGAGIRDMVNFGANVTGFQFVNYFSRNADNAMLGYIWGAGPLGLYTRAYSLMMLPATKLNTPLSNVIVPALSRLVDHPERYRRVYRLAVLLSANVTTPAIAWFLLVSNEAISLLLGDKWVGLSSILLALSGAAFHASTNAITSWIYLSLGRTDRMFRWEICATFFTVVAIAFGLRYGPIGVAASVSIVQLLLKIPGFLYAVKGTFLDLSDFVSPVAFPTLVSLVSIGASWFVIDFAVDSTLDWFVLFLKSLVFIFVYGLFLFLTPCGRNVVGSILSAKRKLSS